MKRDAELLVDELTEIESDQQTLVRGAEDGGPGHVWLFLAVVAGEDQVLFNGSECAVVGRDLEAKADEIIPVAVGAGSQLIDQVQDQGQRVFDRELAVLHAELEEGSDAAGAAGVGEEFLFQDGQADEANGVAGFFMVIHAGLEGTRAQFVSVINQQQSSAARILPDDEIPAAHTLGNPVNLVGFAEVLGQRLDAGAPGQTAEAGREDIALEEASEAARFSDAGRANHDREFVAIPNIL